MDRSRETFEAIERDYTAFLSTIGIEPAAFIPVSATEGDNIAHRSDLTPWYEGPTVLEQLDRFDGGDNTGGSELPLRIPVEDVYKFTESGDDRRIVAGMCESGTLRAGDEVIFYPSGKSTVVNTLEEWFMDADSSRRPTEFSAGKSCGFTMTTQIYVRRGEIACKAGETPPEVGRAFRASMFWLGRSPLVPGKEYTIKSCTAKTLCRVTKIHSVLDASTLEKNTAATEAKKHDIADCTFVCEKELAFDIGASLPATGRFVIVDDYEISGGGIITETAADEGGNASSAAVTPGERARYLCQKPLGVGVPSEEYGRALERRLFEEGRIPYYAARLSDEQKNALLGAGLIVLTQGDAEYVCRGDLPEDLTAILLASDNALEV